MKGYKIANIGVALASKKNSEMSANLKGWKEFHHYETAVSLGQIRFDTL